MQNIENLNRRMFESDFDANDEFSLIFREAKNQVKKITMDIQNRFDINLNNFDLWSDDYDSVFFNDSDGSNGSMNDDFSIDKFNQNDMNYEDMFNIEY